MLAWFTGIPTRAISPVAVPVNQPSVVQSAETIGLEIPDREADCTGARPSWYPFQINTCEVDDPDPVPLTSRHQHI